MTENSENPRFYSVRQLLDLFEISLFIFHLILCKMLKMNLLLIFSPKIFSIKILFLNERNCEYYENYDINSTIFVHPLTHFALSLRKNQFIDCHFISKKNREISFKRVSKIAIIPFGIGRQISVYVSRIFAFNYLNGNVDDYWLKFMPYKGNVSYADNAKIALIKSPNYYEGIDIDKEMKCYFNSDRLLFKNDIFCAKKSDFFQDVEIKSVFFKVVEIFGENSSNSESFLVNSEKTNLFQISSINSELCNNGTESILGFSLDTVQKTAPFFSTYIQRISSFIRASFSIPSNFGTFILLYGSPGCGKRFLAKNIAIICNLHFIEMDCYDLWAEVAGVSEAKIRTIFERAEFYNPCVLLLRNIHILGVDTQTGKFDSRIIGTFQKCLEKLANVKVILIATCHREKFEKLSPTLTSRFLYEIEIENLTEMNRFQLLFGMVPSEIRQTVDLKEIARKTAGFVLADFHVLLEDAKYFSFIDNMGSKFTQSHLEKSLERNRKSYADSIGAPKVPNVRWADVGGLDHAKRVILDTVLLSLRDHDSTCSNLTRSGLLLYGPPGCGKTLLAKAVANECQLTFLAVKGPELLNMYVGQSERNVRQVFERALACSPCAIFFDELDSLAPSRGAAGDSGGVVDRVVSQLLVELDGLERIDCHVIVIGATNRPDLIDRSLLRPGRFDKMLYVGIDNDQESKLRLLQAITRKIQLDSSIDLNSLVSLCPVGMTGADFHSLAAKSTTMAISKIIHQIESGNLDENDAILRVGMDDFMTVLNDFEPSISGNNSTLNGAWK